MTTNEHDTRITKILQKGASVAMPESARTRTRDALAAYAAEHPVIHAPIARLNGVRGERLVPSPFYKYWKKTTMPIIAGIMIASFVGGGVSYAAEGALPGDTLYAMKVHVNEPVREVLALSSEAKAHVEAGIASRRVEEAQRLAITGSISTSTAAELRASFKKHANKAQRASESVRQNDSQRGAHLNASVQTRISADAQILRAIIGTSTDDEDEQVDHEDDERDQKRERKSSRDGRDGDRDNTSSVNASTTIQVEGAHEGRDDEGESSEHEDERVRVEGRVRVNLDL